MSSNNNAMEVEDEGFGGSNQDLDPELVEDHMSGGPHEPEMSGGAPSGESPPRGVGRPHEAFPAFPMMGNGGSSMFGLPLQDQRSPLDTVPAPADFDLEGYMSRYEGYTKCRRLLNIAERCPELAAEAYRLAIRDLQKGIDTATYKQVCQKAAPLLGPEFAVDSQWVSQVERRAANTHERLDLELNTYKTNLMKDKIRMGYTDLGDFHHQRGDLANALKDYLRARDFCVTHVHVAQMCLKVINVSVDSRNFLHVNNYVGKAEHLQDLDDPLILAKIKAVSGLCSLEQKDYKSAARKLTRVGLELQANFSQVIAPEDVAVYGSLCALASCTREEVRDWVLENATFKCYLDLVPKMREVVRDFYHSRYKPALSALEALKGEWLLDLHLAAHVSELCKMIKHKCLTQYFSPYLSVRLASMAEAFGMEVPELEKVLADLIGANQIAARIDTKNGALHIKTQEQRHVSYKKILEMSEAYQSRLRSMLLRLSCLEHDFSIKGKPLLNVGGPGGAGPQDAGDVEHMIMEHNPEAGGAYYTHF